MRGEGFFYMRVIAPTITLPYTRFYKRKTGLVNKKTGRGLKAKKNNCGKTIKWVPCVSLLRNKERQHEICKEGKQLPFCIDCAKKNHLTGRFGRWVFVWVHLIGCKVAWLERKKEKSIDPPSLTHNESKIEPWKNNYFLFAPPDWQNRSFGNSVSVNIWTGVKQIHLGGKQMIPNVLAEFESKICAPWGWKSWLDSGGPPQHRTNPMSLGACTRINTTEQKFRSKKHVDVYVVQEWRWRRSVRRVQHKWFLAFFTTRPGPF